MQLPRDVRRVRHAGRAHATGSHAACAMQRARTLRHATCSATCDVRHAYYMQQALQAGTALGGSTHQWLQRLPSRRCGRVADNTQQGTTYQRHRMGSGVQHYEGASTHFGPHQLAALTGAHTLPLSCAASPPLPPASPKLNKPLLSGPSPARIAFASLWPHPLSAIVCPGGALAGIPFCRAIVDVAEAHAPLACAERRRCGRRQPARQQA